MSEIDNNILTYLKSISELTAIIPAGNIYFIEAPEGTTVNRLVYKKISDPVLYDSDDRNQRWRFFVYHQDRFSCQRTIEILNTNLNRYYGDMGGQYIGYIQRIDIREPEQQGSRGIYFAYVDFKINYHE